MRKSEAINDIKDIKNYAGKEAECEDTTVSEPVPCYAGPSIMEDMHASALPLDLLRQVCEVSLKEYHEGHCSTHDELDAYIKERMGWK